MVPCTIKEVKVSDVITIIATTEMGNQYTFVWFNGFLGDEDYLADPQLLVGQKKTIGYTVIEQYKPDLKKNVLTKQIVAIGN